MFRSDSTSAVRKSCLSSSHGMPIASDFDLHFLSLGGRGRLAETLENLGWPVTALEEPPGLRPRLILRLAQVFRELRADVVHTHDDKPLIYGAPAARLARLRRHLHTHHHGRLPHTTRRQEKLLALAARLPQRMICVSEDCQRWLHGVGVADEKLVTLRNGIDLKRLPVPRTAGEGTGRLHRSSQPGKRRRQLIRRCGAGVRCGAGFSTGDRRRRAPS